MATVEQAEKLITAEEFAQRPDSGFFEELVRGRVVVSPLPRRSHGFACIEIGFHIRLYLEHHPIGRAFGNDSAILTTRGPDTVRGADVAYYSFERLPRDADLGEYGPEVPELAVEVLSPSDRWKKAVVKAGEYLDAGVTTVVVLDPARRTAHVFEADKPPVVLNSEDVLRFESILPGFEVVVGRLFA